MKESSAADESTWKDVISSKSGGIYGYNDGIFTKSAVKLRPYTHEGESFHPWQGVLTPMTNLTYTV